MKIVLSASVLNLIFQDVTLFALLYDDGCTWHTLGNYLKHITTNSAQIEVTNLEPGDFTFLNFYALFKIKHILLDLQFFY